jgi:hypothetical protein
LDSALNTAIWSLIAIYPSYCALHKSILEPTGSIFARTQVWQGHTPPRARTLSQAAGRHRQTYPPPVIFEAIRLDGAMLLWRVDYRGKVLSTLGTVSAMDEKSAIARAAELFNIPFANRNKLVVTEIEIPEKT